MYQVWKTLKKLCEISTFWADQAVLAVLKISAIVLKYPAFEDGFKKYKIRVEWHKVENRPILALTCTSLGLRKATHLQSIIDEKE